MDAYITSKGSDGKSGGLWGQTHRSPLATHFRSRTRRRKRLSMTEASRQLWDSCGRDRQTDGGSHRPQHLPDPGPGSRPPPRPLTFFGASWSRCSQWRRRPWGLGPAVG